MIDAKLALVLERARDADILDVAQRLGARLRKNGGERVGPCLRCGGRDRFSINPAKKVFNCRGCSTGGDVVDLTQHVLGLDFRAAVAWLTGSGTAAPRPLCHEARPRPAAAATPTTTTDIAMGIWRASVDPRGTAVERYLASRGLTLGDEVAMSVIRWNPAARWRGDRRPKPAMVSLMRSIANGGPQAVALTFLAGDVKTGRIFIGPGFDAAVMLDGFDFVTTSLAVGEGVETCMTARQYDFRPCWALGSAGAIEVFPVLSGVESLTLIAEHCERNAVAVEMCGTRWHAAGREVLIDYSLIGKDLNDALRGKAARV
jgi:hypothetical protein